MENETRSASLSVSSGITGILSYDRSLIFISITHFILIFLEENFFYHLLTTASFLATVSRCPHQENRRSLLGNMDYMLIPQSYVVSWHCSLLQQNRFLFFIPTANTAFFVIVTETESPLRTTGFWTVQLCIMLFLLCLLLPQLCN